MKQYVPELINKLAKASACVKLVCGVANNAAWLVCLDALDQAKQHSRWKQRVKGGHSVKGLYLQAVKAHERMEKRLVYAEENRFFHVADMPPGVRKIYGEEFTDRDYFDFWTSIGGGAYAKTRPAITSLWNKYRLSLIHHGIEQPEILAWAMTATACLATAGTLYEWALDDCASGYHLPIRLLRQVFRDFSLKGVMKLWRGAMVATDPAADAYELDSTESRNIEYGLKQLAESWLNLRTLYDSTYKSTADYGEIFRTEGEQQKALRQIAELRSATEKASQTPVTNPSRAGGA